MYAHINRVRNTQAALPNELVLPSRLLSPTHAGGDSANLVFQVGNEIDAIKNQYFRNRKFGYTAYTARVREATTPRVSDSSQTDLGAESLTR